MQDRLYRDLEGQQDTEHFVPDPLFAFTDSLGENISEAPEAFRNVVV
jgi:hypothetical protein